MKSFLSEGEPIPATAETLIWKAPNVMSGEACVRRTRIAVGGLVQQKHLGFCDRDILANFEILTPEDLAAAWAYEAANPQEIREAIRRNTEN